MRGIQAPRWKALPGQRIFNLLLYAIAVVLAAVTAGAIAEWSANPHPLLATEETSSVPRPRTGLVATSENRGQVLFGRYCDSCHTGGRQFAGPSMRTDEFKSEYNTAGSIMEIVRKGGFDMPAFPPELIPDQDLQKIADYILARPKDGP